MSVGDLQLCYWGVDFKQSDPKHCLMWPLILQTPSVLPWVAMCYEWSLRSCHGSNLDESFFFIFPHASFG
jgi:hypothetical protein